MGLTIDIHADSKFPIDRKRLRAVLGRAWEGFQFQTDANLSVAVVGTRKMATLHNHYMGKTGPTDVLAFSQQTFGESDQGFVTHPDAPFELGDIVICYPIALEQAAEENVLLDERVESLAIHGLKNLMGNQE